MAFRKFNRNKEYHGRGGMFEDRNRSDAGMPTKPTDSRDSEMLQQKAFRDLAWGKSITLKADPYTEASTGTDPYSIFNRANRVIDATYPGEVNLAGNVVVQEVHNPNSRLLSEFDVGLIQMAIKYLDLAIRPDDVNTPTNVEVRLAIEEALSHAQSEQFTELPFFNDYYITSMPEMDNIDHPGCTGQYYGILDTTSPTGTFNDGDWFWYVPDAVTVPTIYIYGSGSWAASATGDANFGRAYGGMLVWAQTFLQNVASVPARYNVIRNLEKTLSDMSFDREYPLLVELYGLLKKSAFIAKIKSAGEILPNNYFDRDWFTQMNTLTLVPSRKTDSIRDPLLSVVSATEMPRVIHYTYDPATSTYVQIFDSDTLIEVAYASPDTDPIWGDQDTAFSLDVLTVRIASLLSPAYILRWARQRLEGVGPLATISPVGYFNIINRYIETANKIINKYNPVVADMKVVLNVMNRLGLNSWSMATAIGIGTDSSYRPAYNKLINDVIVENYCGADKMVWDSRTYRWHTSALWNEYLGLPEYLKKQGGAFLTCSIKNIVKPVGVSSDDPMFRLPIMFSIDASNALLMVNRKGDTVQVTRNVVNASTAAAAPELARLYPLTQMASDSVFDIRIPALDLTSLATADEGTASCAVRVLQRLFGLGSVTYNGNTYVIISGDLINLIDIEMVDVTNDMITFAKTKSPFRVQVTDGSRVIGFDH